MNIVQALTEKLGCRRVETPISWSYGGLNQTAVVHTDRGRFFLKRHPSQDIGMYKAEFAGLQAIKDTSSVRVPEPLLCGQGDEGAYLIMEYLEFSSHDRGSLQDLGESLARMHLCPGPEKFGFHMPNTIGTTPQINTWAEDWVDFFMTHRLGFQLRLIEERYRDHGLRRIAEGVLNRFPDFFAGLDVRPSLLHGDLWSGNTGKGVDGKGVIFDPAVYYGHHEAEFGIITMFGGFSEDFYRAYETLIPRKEGFKERVDIYRLYHTLNYYNLFGSSYRDSCLDICKRYK